MEPTIKTYKACEQSLPTPLEPAPSTPPVVQVYLTEKYEKGGLTYSRITGTRTLDEVEKQINAVLATIEGGLDYEWLSFYVDMENRFKKGYMENTCFPRGKILIPASYGNNEGVAVDIFVQDEKTGALQLAVAIKYFHTHEKAYKIACALDEAFYQGLFH